MQTIRAVVATAVLAAVASTTPTALADGGPPRGTTTPGTVAITDPQLSAVLDRVAADGPRTESLPFVDVEVLTSGPTSDADVRAAVAGLGGRITGSVPGHVVQASVPAPAVERLAAVPGADFVRAPRSVGHLPSATEATPEAGTGTLPSPDVTSITNVAAWQSSGRTGSGVKVGIVDYFRPSDWDTAEAGNLPTFNNGRAFCRDTAPVGGGLCNSGEIRDAADGYHGLAVAEVIKDMAPDAELYIASVNTVSDLQAAVDWFATKGVVIISRSLGSAYDGPGDGTGPIAAVADSAAAKGITWFNSGGNDAYYQYAKVSVPTSLAPGGYVDFDPTAGTDTWLRLDGPRILLDGVRWSTDWYWTRSDYSVEFWRPTVEPSSQNWNPSTGQVAPIDLDANPSNGVNNIADNNQRTGGATPLEASDLSFDPGNSYGAVPGWPGGVSYLRIRLNSSSSVGATPDTMEVGLASGYFEVGRTVVAGSAAKPVVDSKNPAVLSVGAIDPPAGSTIATYSAQGPTTDGRVKPDISAPAGFSSVAYGGTFSGTSAAAPVAAGMAAVLVGAGLATPGQGLAALMRHFTLDLGASGADNAFGAGKVVLPAPPPASSTATSAKYVPLATPQRLLDSRAAFHVGPAELTGPFPTHTIIEIDVLGAAGVPEDTDVSAVVLNLASVGALSTGYLQAYPYLEAANGATSTLNISTPGPARPNFAIVPVGVDGKVSVYVHNGGEIVIDVMGYFLEGQSSSRDGRFVALTAPERWIDTRSTPLPTTFGGVARVLLPNETITVSRPVATAVPTSGVDALVVTISAAGATGGGFLRAIPTGGTSTTSNVNFTAASASTNMAIVPLGTGNTISVFASTFVHTIVDVVGYVTDSGAALDTEGLFIPITPRRAYDSRVPPATSLTGGVPRSLDLSPSPYVPSTAIAVSGNFAVTGTTLNGNLKVYPTTAPPTAVLTWAAGKTIAGGTVAGLNGGNATVLMSQGGNLIVDLNGYFLP